jgi:hypothetical protein
MFDLVVALLLMMLVTLGVYAIYSGGSEVLADWMRIRKERKAWERYKRELDEEG